MVKYAAAAAAALVLAVTVAAAVAAEQSAAPSAEQHPQHQNSGADGGDVSWTEVIACYKQPQAAIGCLESRMSRAMVSMRDTAVGLAHSDPDAAAEDVAGVGDLVQQIGEFITYGMSSYFRGGSSDEDETAAQSAGGSPVNAPKDLDEGRGHHKKKKIQKEIKKFVLKVLFGIYLFKQKIKMIIMTIQSILMSKFLVVAMIYAISNTFKIWYDIKWGKHGHHDKVVYYENAHHQHHYEPPEHGEYDDHHGWGSSVWGRSIVATEASVMEPSSGGSPGSQDGISRYIRRVSRTAQPQAGAQAMAYGGQIPSQ
ncbi:uncharacterized protein LOC100168188 [Acyrthosiphon pisum]|uniref:Uncharacterized protein n=1 Tax=Acyrthosiphon pisum TaxID=7029 RepID=A0A8R2A370_ACYPI|nr:uncharacterized protein LOC100168188 [Acyrthosiphon pisum]|eukprot:XP_001943447.1 PREDICTED: uncharacterized protein LOC100168188 [Acyrthosiphon pisum]